MVEERSSETGRAEPADTLAPPADGNGTETTDPAPAARDSAARDSAARDSAARDSAAPSTGAIPTPTDAVTPPSPAVDPPLIDTAGLGTFGTLVTPGPAVPGPDYSTAGVPSLDYVRDKIEGRYAHSLGATELAEGTPEVRSFEEQSAKREEAARDRLEEIRRSLRGGSPS